MNNKEEIDEKFREELNMLIDEEQNFRYLLNEYGIGNKDVTATQLDDSFKVIKKHLRKIRTLAVKLIKLDK